MSRTLSLVAFAMALALFVLAGSDAESEDPRSPTASRRLTVEVRGGYSGPAIEGARVEASRLGRAIALVETDAEGRATLAALPPGAVRIVVRAVGFAISSEIDVSEESHPEGHVVIRLDAAGVLRGRVVAASDGRPLAGARVTAMGGGSLGFRGAGVQRLDRTFGTSTTDADGRFVVEGVARRPHGSVRIVRVDSPGFRTTWKLAPEDGASDDFVIRLVEGGALVGFVTSGGKPAAGARVVCRLTGPTARDPTLMEDALGLPDHMFSPYSVLQPVDAPVQGLDDAWCALVTETDARGRYRLEGLGLGERYSVAARLALHGASPRAYPVRVVRAEIAEVLRLELDQPRRLTVVCADAEQRPIEDGWVLIERSDGGTLLAEGRTDAQGRAHFATLPSERLQVRAYDAEGSRTGTASVVARSGDTAVELVLQPRPSHPPASAAPLGPEPPPTVRARVTLPPGAPAPDAVNYSASWETDVSEGSATWAWGVQPWEPDGAGGTSLAIPVPAYAFRLRIGAAGFLPIERDVRRGHQEVADLGNLRLDVGQVLVGVVRDASGVGLENVRITARGPAGVASVSEHQHEQAVRSGPQGAFRITGLAPGAVDLRLVDKRFLVHEARVELEPSMAPLVITVRSGSILRVHARDQDGFRATRRLVVIRNKAEPDQAAIRGHTDAEGVFMARLPSGAYTVEVGTRDGDVRAQVHMVTLADGVTKEVVLTAPEVE